MSTTQSTKSRRKRLAAVYREAAKLVAEAWWRGCCASIRIASGFTVTSEDLGRFMGKGDSTEYWWPIRGRNSRVIALLLMAELAEDGQLD